MIIAKFLSLIIIILAVNSFAFASTTHKFDPKHCDLRYNWPVECQDHDLKRFNGKHWKKFKEAYLEFQKKLNENDRAAVADLINYPIDIKYVKEGTLDNVEISERKYETLKVNNKEELLNHYDFIFSNNLKLIAKTPYQSAEAQRNSLVIHEDWGRIEFGWACDAEKISSKNCDIVKVTFINNDVITLEQKLAAHQKRRKEMEDNPTPENRRWLKCNMMKTAPADQEDCKDLEMETKMGEHWQEYKQQYFKFVEAVKNDDREAVANMTFFPLSFLYPYKRMSESDHPRRVKSVEIKSKKEFLEKYDFIFTPNLKDFIVNQSKYTKITVYKTGYRLHTTYGGIGLYLDKSKDSNKKLFMQFINNDIVKFSNER